MGGVQQGRSKVQLIELVLQKGLGVHIFDELFDDMINDDLCKKKWLQEQLKTRVLQKIIKRIVV